MSVLYIVLPLALLLVGAAVVAFIWAVRRGQFDDLDSPAVRIVVDEDGEIRAERAGARSERSPEPAADPDHG